MLIRLKVRLNKTNDQFESIKNWYDENKIPPPGSSEDNKKIKLQKLYVEKVRERIVSEIIPNSQNIKANKLNKVSGIDKYPRAARDINPENKGGKYSLMP